MAKRKVPAALFEVIHTAPPPPLNISRARRSWWFTPRTNSARAQVMRSLHPSMIPDELHEPQPAATTATISPEAQLRARFAESSPDVAHEVAVFSADEPEEPDMGDTPSLTPPKPAPGAASEYCDGGLRIDRGRQELTFRFRYTTAALVAFIGLVMLGMAFVVGKRLAETASDDPAIGALRTGQPDPGVLDLDRSASASANSDTANSAIPQAHPVDAAPAPADPAVAAGPVQRTIGLDYLVVQSYPDKKSAQDAADMLTQNGVPCTVEHGLRWAPNWYSVVTAAGYPPHSADGDKLADSIHKVAADQSLKTGHRYRFEPQGYQWNE